MKNTGSAPKARRLALKSPMVRGRPRVMKREDIVDAALDIILKEGHSSLSMRSLAARLKTGAATLYNYFPSQHDVEQAVVERMLLNIKPPDPKAAASLKEQMVNGALIYRNLTAQFPQIDAIATRTPGKTFMRLWNSTMRVLVDAGVPVERVGLTWTLLAGLAHSHAQGMLENRNLNIQEARSRQMKELPASDFDMLWAYIASPFFKGSLDDTFRLQAEMTIDHLMPELGYKKAGRKPKKMRK